MKELMILLFRVQEPTWPLHHYHKPMSLAMEAQMGLHQLMQLQEEQHPTPTTGHQATQQAKELLRLQD